MHSFEFIDQKEADPKNLIAVGRDLRDDERLELAFDSIMDTTQIVYNNHKVGILVYNKKQPSFVIQAEYANKNDVKKLSRTEAKLAGLVFSGV